MALAVVVLQKDIEALRVTQLGHRRGCKGKGHRILDLRQRTVGASLHGRNGLTLTPAIAPVPEQHETNARVLSATAETEARNREDRLD